MARILLLLLLISPSLARAQHGAVMNCSITGKIIKILPITGNESGVCRIRSCMAKVKILSIDNKGSAFTHDAVTGDTVTMRFSYSLSTTKKIFPGLKPALKGLKNGSKFTAKVTQQLVPGNSPLLVVGAYTRIK